MTKLTREQQTAVEARGKVIVTASAGSGKTFVMIERLMERILSGEAEVDRILALTFTNKAAAQMREKLRRALLDRIKSAEGEERALLKRQIEKLPLAEIGTFHSFCARLVRTHFYLVGVDPSFTIVSPDDARGKAVSARALTQTFDDLYEEDSAEFRDLLAVYFRKKKDKFLRDLVLSLYAEVRGESRFRDLLARAGEEEFDDTAAALYAVFSEQIGFVRERAASAASTLAGNARAMRVAEAVTEGCALLLGCDLFTARERAAALSVPAMPPMTKAEGEELAALRALSGASKEFKGVLSALGEIAPRETEMARAEDAARRARALGKLLLCYDERYTAIKREENVLDYNDLEHLALAVLSDPVAAASVKENKKFVFVDEYQDVNAVQEELLSRLTEGELFLVGDAKQAIYGFRGSNAAFFREKVSSFGAGALPLSSNFRSADAVLGAVNRVFAPLMADYLPAQGGGGYGEHRGDVVFHRIGARKREKRERGVYSVENAPLPEEDDPLSSAVLAIVGQELRDRWFDLETGKMRPVRPGDIAVLVRKNSGDAERVVRALARRNLPVTTSSKVNVLDFYESNLLLDWFSYLDDREQDIPLASAMLSAAGGFTENDLAAIRLRFPRDLFRDACRKYAQWMADGISARLKAFAARTEELVLHACVRNASEVAYELLAAGLEAQIAALPDGDRRLSRVRRFLAEAEDLSVHAFLEKLRTSDYRVEYAETGGEDAVKVVTMHAAKGLEYPVVILASLDAPFHGADRDEVMWSREHGFAPKSYSLATKTVGETLLRRLTVVTAEKKEREEEKNLLYVGMTRAKYRLHMIFGEKEARPPWRAGRFSDFIDLDACADYFSETPAELPPLRRRPLLSAPTPASEALSAEILSAMRALPAGGDAPVKSSATELMRMAHDGLAPLRGEGGGHSAEEGSAYHAFLEHVRFGEDARAEKERMARDGVLPPEQLALLDDSRLQAILSMPCLRSLAGKRVWRERKFLVSFPARDFAELFSSEDGIVFQGAIDLIAEDGEGYLIVDYKDSSLGGEQLKEKYALQMKLYRKTVGKIFRVPPSSVRVRIVNIARCEETEM